MSKMPVIDWIFASLILLMVIHGYLKGFIEELFSWAALVLALWAAVILFPAGGAYIRTRAMANVRVIPELLAFIAIFLIITAVVKILGGILKNVISGANLGGVNKILGAVFGIIEGAAITALVIFLLRAQPLFDPSKILGESFFARILGPIIRFPQDRGRNVVDTVLLIAPGFQV
jgi:membrane protein required for colicin V production